MSSSVSVLSDLRYSARSLARAPGTALGLVVTIAIGIGSNAAVHGFVRGLQLAPSPETTAGMAMGLERIGTPLIVAAGAVFFTACANVALLLLARASARSQETATRVALGARRAQLARQLLADSVLLALAGGALGLLLAAWTTRIVPALLFSRDADALVFAPDVVGIAVASIACLVITIACGLLPVLELRADRPAAVLQRESAGPSTAMRRLRATLVVLQMALCCMLVIATGLLHDALRSALVSPGAQHLNNAVVVTVEAQPRPSRASAASFGLAYFHNIEAAASVPGATPRAWVSTLPGGRPSWQHFRVEPPDIPRREVTLDVVPFAAASVAQVMLPPVRGRAFGGQDTPTSCRVAMINEAAGEVFAGDPIGQSIQDPTGQQVEIIGVVATRSQATGPAIYYYAEQTEIPIESPGPARFLLASQVLKPAVALDSTIVSNSYFAVMDWPPVAGAMISDRETTGSCRVAMVNEQAAERHFGGNAVGAAVIDGLGRRTEIIGVVRATPILTLQSEIEPALYLPMAQDFLPRMTLVLETAQPSASLLAHLYRQLDAVPGRGRAEVEVRTLDSHLRLTSLAPLRIAFTLVGVSAAMALVLGVLGLYGAMTEAARQRRREIATRVALGAQGWRVVRQVVFEGLRLAALGIVAGIMGSALVARLLSGIAPSEGPNAIWIWLAAPLILVGAVAVASVLPARRALSTDPLTIMRASS